MDLRLSEPGLPMQESRAWRVATTRLVPPAQITDAAVPTLKRLRAGELDIHGNSDSRRRGWRISIPCSNRIGFEAITAVTPMTNLWRARPRARPCVTFPVVCYLRGRSIAKTPHRDLPAMAKKKPAEAPESPAQRRLPRRR